MRHQAMCNWTCSASARGMACVLLSRTASYSSESFQRLRFGGIVMCGTGSDELMALTNGLASYFGHEGPTHDIPGFHKSKRPKVSRMWDRSHAWVSLEVREWFASVPIWQHARQLLRAAAERRRHGWPSKCKAALLYSSRRISCQRTGMTER